MQSYWACAQLVANRTALALHCLEHVAGYEIYCSRLAPPRRRSGNRLRVPQLLFPGYTFLNVANGAWWSARWAAGVVRLVMDGAQPARVPDAVIGGLRDREGSNGLIELPKPPGLKVGDQVKILQGPLRGLCGLYQGQRGHERVLVLMSILGQQRVELSKDSIERIDVDDSPLVR